MCGGSKKSTPAAPVNLGYQHSPADYSNVQRQKLAVDPAAGKQASYGSELASAGSTPTTQGGM